MTKILFVNHTLGENCGLFAHGKRLFRILEKSTKYIFKYVECQSLDALKAEVEKENSRLIIYNYVPACMGWAEQARLALPNKTHICITHDLFPGTTTSDYLAPFDYRIVVDPSIVCNGRWFKCSSRPLFGYKVSNPVVGVPEVPIIGTFGFFLPHKHFANIIQSVESEFKKAIINMHLTLPFFDTVNLTNQLGNFGYHALEYLKDKDIKLNITSSYVNDEQLITLLSKNDLNVFFYSLNVGSGPSSGIDYAVAAGKPVITNSSYQFKHVNGKIPVYPETSLSKAMEIGNGEILKLQEEWSDEKVLHDYESMIEQIG